MGDDATDRRRNVAKTTTVVSQKKTKISRCFYILIVVSYNNSIEAPYTTSSNLQTGKNSTTMSE